MRLHLLGMLLNKSAFLFGWRRVPFNTNHFINTNRFTSILKHYFQTWDEILFIHPNYTGYYSISLAFFEYFRRSCSSVSHGPRPKRKSCIAPGCMSLSNRRPTFLLGFSSLLQPNRRTISRGFRSVGRKPCPAMVGTPGRQDHSLLIG